MMFEKLTRFLKGEPDELSGDECVAMKLIEKYRDSFEAHPTFIGGELWYLDCIHLLGENEFLYASLQCNHDWRGSLPSSIIIGKMEFTPWEAKKNGEWFPNHGHTQEEGWRKPSDAGYRNHHDWILDKSIGPSCFFKKRMDKTSGTFNRFMEAFFKEKAKAWNAVEACILQERKKRRARAEKELEESKIAAMKQLL